MKATNVRIAGLTTYEQCSDAIESIEFDAANVVGGHGGWASGYETDLTVGAEKKIAAIRRKMDSFPCGECGETTECEC